ncbi:hypothetical protein N7489_002182 [Penicillium chrysogenum]|uniref:uncharacterized protein n=1 Tax=Penicillium chrysogenum TaxID=5076 RepID=UPI0024DF2B1C|nr:uncharacterized protein N7489_002182 [Penicillium chrysogenum]KAJ5251772.1 hypothetical protein N7489_002182 [Penicillium chrysogenum]
MYPGNELLRYQVGRACATGGYTLLYLELGLLPDVGIAEARDNRTCGQAIYESIIINPTRWASTVRLLCEPLSTDLPTVYKDILILMAAWSGNIRRPCVVRGIYHHPFFAKWWLGQKAS